MGFYIDMIDVGQGDAFLLTLGTAAHGDVTILIDGGPPSAGGTVADFVKVNAAGRLNAVIGTHLDIDHIGGLKDVVARCDVDAFYLNLPRDPKMTLGKLLRQRWLERKKSGVLWERVEKSLSAATDLAETLQRRGLVPQPLMAGSVWQLEEVVLRVLNPTPARLQAAWDEIEGDESPMTVALRELSKRLGLPEAPETSAENNSSVVLELEYRTEPYALLTGDAGADVLKEVTSGKRYPFLKVPHHGSKTGLDAGLVAQLRPATAYIPVGDNNYGHPAIEVLDLLREHGAKTYCSQKTADCRKECPPDGFGNLCHRKDREFRPGWGAVDPSKCANNC
jgi:beta-lactamase superfamily II metal-dependent hydrolase